ncbi:MAG TPA: hypothetical protein VEW68_01440 [Patescibacteria group bacterium]|nr:hypothetical protein [Patescibacteria group bacterium]
MWPIRVSAAASLLFLSAYWALREVAARCTGIQCDFYIIPSIGLPLLVLIAVGITGWLAISWARPVGGMWLSILIGSTAIGLLGPPIALAVFRDQPDSLVLTASLLFAQGPVAALVYTIAEVPSRIP